MKYQKKKKSYFLETIKENPFTTRIQKTFLVIHEKEKKKKILLIFQLPYNQYPFRIFRHPETVIATLSYQPYNPVC